MAKTDRFGQEYRNVPCHSNKNGYPVGYVMIARPGLYKLEPGEAGNVTQDRKGRDVTHWVRVTKMPRNQQQQGGGSFGGGNGGRRRGGW